MNDSHEIKVEIANSQERFDVNAEAIERVVKRAVLEWRSMGAPDKNGEGSSDLRAGEHPAKVDAFRALISVAIVDNSAIRRLKKEFLDIDETTDVLAFPLSDPDQIAEGYLEGEIVISAEKAFEEAAARKSDPEAELCLYAVHGALHLVGYDDCDPAKAATMYRKEGEILSWAGYGNVR